MNTSLPHIWFLTSIGRGNLGNVHHRSPHARQTVYRQRRPKQEAAVNHRLLVIAKTVAYPRTIRAQVERLKRKVVSCRRPTALRRLR